MQTTCIANASALHSTKQSHASSATTLRNQHRAKNCFCYGGFGKTSSHRSVVRKLCCMWAAAARTSVCEAQSLMHICCFCASQYLAMAAPLLSDATGTPGRETEY
eukprot:20703-Heterococcus_DN1.PRE.3